MPKYASIAMKHIAPTVDDTMNGMIEVPEVLVPVGVGVISALLIVGEEDIARLSIVARATDDPKEHVRRDIVFNGIP